MSDEARRLNRHDLATDSISAGLIAHVIDLHFERPFPIYSLAAIGEEALRNLGNDLKAVAEAEEIKPVAIITEAEIPVIIEMLGVAYQRLMKPESGPAEEEAYDALQPIALQRLINCLKDYRGEPIDEPLP